jgi:hypothetical protein
MEVLHECAEHSSFINLEGFLNNDSLLLFTMAVKIG